MPRTSEARPAIGRIDRKPREVTPDDVRDIAPGVYAIRAFDDRADAYIAVSKGRHSIDFGELADAWAAFDYFFASTSW